MSYQETQGAAARTADEYIEQLPESILRALNVWLILGDEERNGVLKATELMQEMPEEVRSKLRQHIINVHTGPYEGSCRYCGRG